MGAFWYLAKTSRKLEQPYKGEHDMAFRTLFWNIENYSGDPARTQTLVQHIQANSPEIVGFSEIKDKAALRSILQESLTDYDFGITDGQEGIELLAGWKRGVFAQALFTQRREFKSGNPFLRPGSLLSVKRNGTFYNVLFLHTDSGRKSTDYANRQDMFERIWSLRERLDEIEEGVSRFLVLGDLNTMGRSASGTNPAVTAADEISNLSNDAQQNGMRLLAKSHPNTWARVNDQGQITLQSNLDHVLVSDSVPLVNIANGQEVLVRGWVDATTDASRLDFVEGISDHSSIEMIVDA